MVIVHYTVIPAVRFGVMENRLLISRMKIERCEMTKYRVVLTCYDTRLNVPPYTDYYNELQDTEAEGHAMAMALAEGECKNLNDGSRRGGSFEVDECGPDVPIAVRWYEKALADREETDCDIETVTEYEVFPVTEEGEEIRKKGLYAGERRVIRYRGFDIYPNKNRNRYTVKISGVTMTVAVSFVNALKYVDDVHLRNSEKYKTNGGRTKEVKYDCK